MLQINKISSAVICPAFIVTLCVNGKVVERFAGVQCGAGKIALIINVFYPFPFLCLCLWPAGGVLLLVITVGVFCGVGVN